MPPGTDVSTCTRHLRDGQLLLDQITARRPAHLRVCPECAIATLELLYPAPPSPHPRQDLVTVPIPDSAERVPRRVS